MILATSSQLLGFESLSEIYTTNFSYSSSNKDLKEQRFYETYPFTKLAHN
jgi:hypothetical protein